MTPQKLGDRIRVWLPGFYLVLLVAFATLLIYTNHVAQRFLDIVSRTEPGQELAAAQAMRSLQTLDPGLPMYTIGQAYYQGKHVVETLKIVPCTRPPERLAEAEQSMLDEAITAYERGLHFIKAHPLYWANLASLYWLDRQPVSAQAALEQAIRLSDISDPKIEIYLLNSGCYDELQGQTSAAITAYARLLQRNPALITSAFWTASAFRAGHLSQIIDAVRHLPGNPQDQLVAVIKIKSAQNDSAAAEALLAELVATWPDSVTTVELQARSLLQRQRYQESLALARQIEHDQLLGQVALAMGDTATARTYLKKALFNHLDDPATYFYLAQVALAEGHPTEAIAYLERITPPYTPPTTSDVRFVYGYPADFSIYPSLLMINTPPLQAQPFQLLAQLYQEAGQMQPAQTVQQALLTYDPYMEN